MNLENTFDKTKKMFDTYAFEEYLIPIIPVVLRDGIKGNIQLENYNGTVEELIYQHYCYISENEETAKNKMKDFLEKIYDTSR